MQCAKFGRQVSGKIAGIAVIGTDSALYFDDVCFFSDDSRLWQNKPNKCSKSKQFWKL